MTMARGPLAMKNIAILVPSYNSANTLAPTLRSILDQGHELGRHIDFIMLSDDGSTDATVALAESTWTHPTVPLQVKRADVNQGEYRNVNGAFAAMPPHIEWVLVMHADNEALPGWIEVLARECGRAGDDVATICGSWHYVVDGKLADAGDARGADYVETIVGSDKSVRESIFAGCWWHNSTAAIRVSAWKEVGGHPQETPLLGPLEMLGLRTIPSPPQRKLRIKGDWDVLLRLLSSGKAVVYVGTPVIRYIEQSASVSGGSFAWHGDLLETLQVMRRHQAVLSAKDIFRLHGRNAMTLGRRFGGAVLRGHWRRAGFAVQALPYLISSLMISILDHAGHHGGRLTSIPFGPALQQ